jgi:hypothetical protein
MNSRDADALGLRLADLLAVGEVAEAYAALSPHLALKTPFRLLDRIAAVAGRGPWPRTIALLDRIASDGREGGWVIIGTLLWQQYPGRPAATILQCRQYIIAADTWYGADILGERVPGPAMVADFDRALDLAGSWREDANRWVRRSLGVAVHFWAKRSRGDQKLVDQAQALLEFLSLMFDEWEMDATKGVGWGLKTLGRHYPDQVASWLMAQSDRPHRRLILRKALTYLPDESRQDIMGAYGL